MIWDSRSDINFSFDFQKHLKTNSKKYIMNNWFKYSTSNNLALNDIYNKGGAIWITSEGDICYRFSLYGRIHTAPISKINLVLSSFLGYSVQITTKEKKITIKKPKLNDKNEDQKEIVLKPIVSFISIMELLLVEDEKFNPFQRSEFYTENGLIYRNTFKPSIYLSQEVENLTYKKSIILQYIYYLSNYDKLKFKYFMNWLAIFFQELSSRTNIALVLLGGKDSRKEILFDEIIQPLFGEEYTRKIGDDTLKSNQLTSIFKNKLFYNFNKISKTSLEDKKTQQIINDILEKFDLYVDNGKNTLEKIKIHGQTLITIDEPKISYIDRDYEYYTVFKVPDNMKKFHLSKDTVGKEATESSITDKNKFIDLIRNDLENFSKILKSYQIDYEGFYKPFMNDDKDKIQNSLEDKLKAFTNAILLEDESFFKPIEKSDFSLYDELINDIKEHKIKQQNLIKCFDILYKEEGISHPKTLMVKLRKINESFFEVKAIKTGTGGIKYYEIPR